MKDKSSQPYNISQLGHVIAQLRGPNGCPWDRKQTHERLARYAIEEAAELSEAILMDQDHRIKEELGDVLLQVVLHSQIAKELVVTVNTVKKHVLAIFSTLEVNTRAAAAGIAARYGLGKR